MIDLVVGDGGLPSIIEPLSSAIDEPCVELQRRAISFISLVMLNMLDAHLSVGKSLLKLIRRVDLSISVIFY